MTGELVRWTFRWVGALIAAPALLFAVISFSLARAESARETDELMIVGVVNGGVPPGTIRDGGTRSQS